MKKIIIITLISFSLIIISGQHFGGPYIIYLIFGLTYPTNASLVGLFGIIMMMALLFKKVNNLLNLLITISSSILLLLSLIIFFKSDKYGYNHQTFEVPIPIISITVFVFLIFYLNYKTIKFFLLKKNCSIKKGI